MRGISIFGALLVLVTVAQANKIHDLETGEIRLGHKFDQVNDRIDQLAADVASLKESVDRLANRLDDPAGSPASPFQPVAMKTKTRTKTVCEGGVCRQVAVAPADPAPSQICLNGVCENGECPPGVCQNGQCSGGACLVGPASFVPMILPAAEVEVRTTYQTESRRSGGGPFRRVGRALFKGGGCCGR